MFSIRDPWSNPPGIDRPEGGLKTQSPHITHISAYGFTEYSIPSRSTVHMCMLMGLTLKLALLAIALVRSLLSRSAASPRLTPALLALPTNLASRLLCSFRSPPRLLLASLALPALRSLRSRLAGAARAYYAPTRLARACSLLLAPAACLLLAPARCYSRLLLHSQKRYQTI
jgi:hypothetical protein